MKRTGYGYFLGGDPRNFIPDIQMCTEAELQAWGEAYKAWNEGNEVVCEGSHRWITDAEGKVIGTATVASFGIGTYTYDDGEGEEDE